MRRYAMLAIAAVFFAVNANAVDLHGYFRQGFGGSSKGGDQVAFSNSGQDFKLRLGNEDNWSEFEFVQPLLKDKNGVEWTMGFMLGWGNGFSQQIDIDRIALQQEYLKATFPQLGGATVWGGKRFYHRHANDIYDYFYLNESGYGVGIEDVDVGFGKMAVALMHYQAADNSTDISTGYINAAVTCAQAQANPASTADDLKAACPDTFKIGGSYHPAFWIGDFRLEGIPVNPGGTLNLAVLLKVRSWNKEVAKGFITADFAAGELVPTYGGTLDAPDGKAPDKTQDFSPFIMVKHSQSGILNGGNNLAVTYKTGCFLNDDCNENRRKLTVSEDLSLSPTKEFSVVLAGIFMNDQDDAKVKKNQWSVGVRPLFKLADHFAIQGDAGSFWNKTDKSGAKANTMFLATVAPTITPFTDAFYGAHSAPEIRFFATYANWNKEQDGDHKTFDAKGKTESGMTYGAQVEAWF